VRNEQVYHTQISWTFCAGYFHAILAAAIIATRLTQGSKLVILLVSILVKVNVLPVMLFGLRPQPATGGS
jgi:hypothetical protein